jgi:polyhydroxybutyrate depolymerase
VIRILLPACGILTVFAIACSSAGSKSGTGQTPTQADSTELAVTQPGSGCQPPLRHAPGSASDSLTSDGQARTYILHVPTGYDGGTRVPLVVAYPGYGQPADSMAVYDGLDAVSDASGFILVTPNALGSPQFWNEWQSANLPDDVQFTKDLIAKLEGQLCIDTARIFSAGYSNGGGMALRVACAMPETIAAVAVVSAYYPNCTADVPLIAFQGTDDPVVPFEGGQSAAFPGVNFPVVRRAVSEWARTLGCDGLATISHPSQNVELSTYSRCVGGDGEALLYTIIGGGHTWPGATLTISPLLGETTNEINASATMWTFLAAHPLGG